MKKYLPALAATLLLTASAQAQINWVYNVGPNYVNMSGASCRTATALTENNVTHNDGKTQTNFARRSHRLFCPIARRGTSDYATGTSAVNGAKRVKITNARVYATDASSESTIRCFTFGARLSDQALYFGTARSLCSSSDGCQPPFFNQPAVPASWTGTNTVNLPGPPGFDSVDTLNFGITCDVGPNSTIHYTESNVTPNH